MARRRKSDDPLVWVFTILLLIPIGAFWLLKQLATLVSVGVKKSNAKRTSRSNYSRSSTTNKTRSIPYKANTSQSTQQTQNRTTTKTKTANTSKTYSGENKISLYEALRIPGDPDPAFGGCTCFVNVSNTNNTTTYQGNTTTDYDEYEEEYDTEEMEDFNGDMDIDEEDAILMGLAVHDMFTKHKDEEDEDNFYEDDSDYSWETHCEYCGELLEDCVCDHRHESHEAISLWDCGCDDDDDWGSSGRDNDDGWGSSSRDDDRDGLADFDEFRSF
ncbi:MAG: hypothetical protein IJX81_02460 [Clostridia bacterium]|nr:hypothetical protein [Clostridia bacterium]